MAEKWLVIDDSATIQRVIKLAFQDYEVLITEADSIQEGLRELARSPSTLIIADAALAGVQSVQDFVRLQQTAPASAFVILEGSYDHIDESQFRGAGFRHFLKKPFDAGQLVAITREALGRNIPHRYHEGTELLTPPPPMPGPGGLPFSLNDEGPKAPPPPPGFPQKSLDEELEHPFGDEGFDLGLDNDAEPNFRAEPAFQAEPSFRPAPAQPALSFGSLDEEEDADPGQNRAFEASYERPREASYNPQALSGMLEPMLREEMEKIVRQTVEEYCRKHFAELAREFLLREIEKLSSERARLLVDK